MSRDECEANCERILEWASTKRGKPFDTTTIKNILRWVQENDFATDRQLDCTNNIIETFKIPHT